MTPSQKTPAHPLSSKEIAHEMAQIHGDSMPFLRDMAERWKEYARSKSDSKGHYDKLMKKYEKEIGKMPLMPHAAYLNMIHGLEELEGKAA